MRARRSPGVCDSPVSGVCMMQEFYIWLGLVSRGEGERDSPHENILLGQVLCQSVFFFSMVVL